MVAAKKKTTVKKKAKVSPKSSSPKSSGKKAATTKKATSKKTASKTSTTKKAVKKAAIKKSVKKVAPTKSTPKTKVKVKKKAASVKKTPAQKKSVPKTAKKKTALSPSKDAVKKSEPVTQETPLTTPVLDSTVLKIKDKLIEERKNLLGLIKSSQAVERNLSDINFSNEIDLASSLEGRELAFQLSSRERNELKMIEEALFRISNGTYGICDECEKKISVKRLQIMPLTPLCIECQENLETR